VGSYPMHSLRDFKAKLRRMPEVAFSDIGRIHKFLTEHPVDPDTLQPYLIWDQQHYTRNLIDKTPLYELLAICWEVGQASAVHNHKDQNCWMAVPVGRLMVQNYRVLHENPDAGECRIEKADIVEMNLDSPEAVDREAPVHKVFNPRGFNNRAVSLHIYSRPFDTCTVYSEEKQTCAEIRLSYTSEYGEGKRTQHR
jgi:predicted metal-dependent enzyme (double-stranded beta helix superfamily)